MCTCLQQPTDDVCNEDSDTNEELRVDARPKASVSQSFPVAGEHDN